MNKFRGQADTPPAYGNDGAGLSSPQPAHVPQNQYNNPYNNYPPQQEQYNGYQQQQPYGQYPQQGGYPPQGGYYAPGPQMYAGPQQGYQQGYGQQGPYGPQGGYYDNGRGRNDGFMDACFATLAACCCLEACCFLF